MYSIPNFKNNSALYAGNNSSLDPNSNFYKWNKRSIPDYFQLNTGIHLTNYEHNPSVLDDNYRNIYQEPNPLAFRSDNMNESTYDICAGASDNKIYHLLKRYTELSPVAKLFFSKGNLHRIQKLIKAEVLQRTQGRFILTEDQSDDDLVIVMAYIYQEYGRNLPDHVVHQVKRLNLRTVNYLIPDVISNIKQYYNYQKEINEPIKPIDRPVNFSNKGRKLLPSITTVWSM